MLQLFKIKDVGSDCFECFHTQEYRGTTLDFPILCSSSKAWLGTGYYFWFDEIFAKYWGEDFKSKNTGFYDVYKCYVEDKDILNMCFCEEDYFFVKKNLDKLIERIKNAKGVELTLKQVHRLFKSEYLDKAGINGIIYDDLPKNNYSKDRTYSLIEPLYYVKRIQLVVFNKSIIHNFEPHLEEQQ